MKVTYPVVSTTAPKPSVDVEYPFVTRVYDAMRYLVLPKEERELLSHKAQWRKGIAEEVYFWDGFIGSKGGKWPEDFVERFDANLPLQPYLAEIISAPKGATIRILDVGAGPLTFVGRTSPDWEIEITPVDPLADAYDQILAHYELVPPVRTLNVAAEEVEATFPANHFDLVTARNTLDHAFDPAHAILQMLAVAKPGGKIHLAHHIDEASNNANHGLHQWNFRVEDGVFVIENQGRKVNMDERLHPFGTVDNIVFDEKWLVTIVTKHV